MRPKYGDYCRHGMQRPRKGIRNAIKSVCIKAGYSCFSFLRGRKEKRDNKSLLSDDVSLNVRPGPASREWISGKSLGRPTAVATASNAFVERECFGGIPRVPRFSPSTDCPGPQLQSHQIPSRRRGEARQVCPLLFDSEM